MLMPWPLVAAAGIAAAGSLIGGQQASAAAGSATSQGRQYSLDMYKRQRSDFLKDRKYTKSLSWAAEKRTYGREDSTYQRAVADAQAAGLHPLFAMGSGASYSGGGNFGGSSSEFNPAIPGYPSGGSARSGVSEAGQAVSRAIIQGGQNAQSKAAFALQATRVAAEVMRDEAQANYYNSLAAKTAQEANSGPRMTEDGSYVIPLGGRSGVPLTTKTTTTPRATRIQANVNAPLWTTVEKPGGGSYRVLNEAVQADEINQLLIAAQGTFDFFQKAGEAIGFKPWELGRKAYTLFRRKAYRKGPIIKVPGFTGHRRDP